MTTTFHFFGELAINACVAPSSCWTALIAIYNGTPLAAVFAPRRYITTEV